jgi:hypothetical protein
MRAQRHPHEACRLREVDVVELLLQLVSEQLGELVLDALAFLVGERHVARIGADAQHLGIDQLEREVAAITRLRASDIADRTRRRHHTQQDQPATMSSGLHRASSSFHSNAIHATHGRTLFAKLGVGLLCCSAMPQTLN